MADPLQMLWNVVPPQQIISASLPLFIICGGGILFLIAWHLREQISKWPLIRKIEFIIGRYPHEIRIYEDREGGVYTETDWARRVNKDDESGNTIEYYELYNMAVAVPIPEFEHLMTGINGRLVAHFYSPSRDIFYPITMIRGKALPAGSENIEDVIDIKLHPLLDEKMKALFRYLTEKKYRKWYKQDTLDKWMPFITIMGVGISIAIWFMLTSGRLELIAKSFEAMVPPLQTIAQKLPEFVAAVNKTTIPLT